MALKTLIVDDEPLARDGIRNYVQEIDFLEDVATAKDGMEAISVLNKQSIDLMLLDINMPKLTGIDLLKTITNPPLTIFTTAYPNHALEGYQLNVIDYLVKPISFPRFLTAALKAREQYELIHQQLNTNSADASTAEPNFFFIKSDGRTERIEFEELLFAEAMQNYVKLYTTRGEFMPLLPLKILEEQLPHPRFYRVHKSYLVQLKKVQSIEGNQLHLNEHRIPMSRSKVGELQELIVKGRLLE